MFLSRACSGVRGECGLLQLGVPRRQCRQFIDQGFGARPFAVARGRVQVADFAQVDQATAPGLGQFGDTLEVAERVVAAGRDDAWKRQRAGVAPAASRRRAVHAAWDSRPARACSKSGGVASSAPSTGRCRAQRPVHQHDHAAAVRDDDQRPFDRLRRTFDGRHTLRAGQVDTAHRRHAGHRAAGGAQACFEQRLPVLCDVVAQPGHDQHGGIDFAHGRGCFEGVARRAASAYWFSWMLKALTMAALRS